MNIEKLKGKILKEILTDSNDGDLVFITNDDKKYVMYHMQECCEQVTLEDICGDLDDLIGNPLIEAEEVEGSYPDPENIDSCFKWTFYKLATIKGCVTLRWHCESNGYYSIDVDFKEIVDKERE